MPSSHPLPPSCQWFSRLASALDPRSAPRLAWLFVGAVLARGRRTVTSWIRAAGLSGEYRRCYTTVVSRLRKDANRRSEPGPRPPRRRGPRRISGEHRIDLAGRAGRKRGRVSGTFTPYGKPTPERYETSVATWRPAGGAIRVVLVDEPTGWVAFFCTDPSATVDDILGSVAGRFSLEVAFRDLKEVVGAGQQQVRLVRASVGALHLGLWACTMTEAWAWKRDEKELAGHRSASPWDDLARRPSHADKRRAWRRELLGEEIHAALRPGLTEREIAAAAERLLNLAAWDCGCRGNGRQIRRRT